MSDQTVRILEEALQLSPTDRAAVVERLLSSLDRPDTELDTLWAREAEARIAASAAGDMQSISAEEVFAELEEL